MPRPPRRELAGGIHHVTAHSPSGRWLFTDDHDCSTYLGLLAGQVEKRGWQLFHYCLMGNHLHLLLRTPKRNLGAGIKVVHEQFAMHVNARRTERGHVFGGRFYNGVVVEQQHFEACMRYIGRNPVAAGLCTRAGAWRWSAHGSLVGEHTSPCFLDIEGALGLIHGNVHAGRVAYEHWVEQSDHAVLERLEAREPGNAWLISAIDGHRIELATIMSFKGWSRATTYRRLRAARETEGSDPPVSAEATRASR